MPDQCPRCGAAAVGDDYVIGGGDYVCGTIVVRQEGRHVVVDGETCLRRQVAALREALRDIESDA